MSRRHRGLSPTLFPFLAVLVCTMGTLLLLLALVTQKANQDARAEAEAAVAQEQKNAEDDVRWQTTQLVSLRKDQTQQLENKRGELAHLEDHLRRLDQQLRQLTDQVAAATSNVDQAALQADIDRLQRQSAALQVTLAARRNEVSTGRPPRVAIVPHRGPNGTQRRPVYLECTGDAVILQPEGVRIPVSVLRGPMGPGNPLDAALRAIRLHWQQTDPEPPYPLLIVRPDGIMAYATARTAMTAWDDQFGYELVPANVELEYSTPEPLLADRVNTAVTEAVQRQQLLMAAMPGRFQVGGYNDPMDQAMADAGSADPDDPNDPLNQLRGSATRPLSDEAAGTFVETPGAPLTGGRIGNAEGTTGSGAGGGAYASSTGQPTSPPQAPTSSRRRYGGGGPSSEQPTTNGIAGTPASLTNAAAGSSPAPSNPPGTQGSTTGAMSGSDAMQNAMQGGDAMQGSPSTGADANGNSASSVASGAASSAAASARSAGGQHGGPDGGNPSAITAGMPVPLSQRRGRNWALPEGSATHGPTVVRRIAVRSSPQGYELQDGDALRPFPLDLTRPENAVIELAGVVRQRVEKWGPALAGGNWQPLLSVEVVPGGEAHYALLARLLDGSGIQVERRTP